MDGDDFDQVFITFKPELAAVLLLLVRPPDPVGQTASQSFDTGYVCRGLLQQFGKMEEIGQYAFSARQCQQSADIVLVCQQGMKHGQKSLLQQDLSISMKSGCDFVYRLFLVMQSFKLWCIIAEKIRGQQGSGQVRIVGLQESAEKGKHMLRFPALQDAALAGIDTGDIALCQCIFHGFRLAMGPNKNADISTGKRSVGRLCFRSFAACEESGNFMGAEAGGLFRRLFFGQGFAGLLFRKKQAGKRRDYCVVDGQGVCLGQSGSLDPGKFHRIGGQ